MTLTSALAVQLWNSIAEGKPPKPCAYELCENAFIRQFGRSQAGQHRTESVMYCSRRCANNAAQRRRLGRKVADH